MIDSATPATTDRARLLGASLRRHAFPLASVAVLALVPSCGGGSGGGSSGGGIVDHGGFVLPIASQRLVAPDEERPLALARWMDDTLVTASSAGSSSGGGSSGGGLVVSHCGVAGRVDWLVHVPAVWTPGQHAGIGTGSAWLAARRPGSALLARVDANGSVGAQTEIEDAQDLSVEHASALVDEAGHAFFFTDHVVARVDAAGQPEWAYRAQDAAGIGTLWAVVDPRGGLVCGTEASPLRAVALAPDGVVRWSRDLVLPADHTARVIEARVDPQGFTTLLVLEGAAGVAGTDLVIVSIAADGTTTARTVRGAGAAFGSAELLELAPVDGGRRGWVLLLATAVTAGSRAYDVLHVDEHGTVVWAQRIERPLTSLLGASLVAFDGGGAAVRFVYAVAPNLRIARFGPDGTLLWKRGLRPPDAGVEDDPSPPVPEPRPRIQGLAERQHGPPAASAASRERGLGQILALARPDGGMFLPSYVPGVGLAVCAIDVDGGLEWAARIASIGSLHESLNAPLNTGYLHGSSSGVPFVVHLDPVPSGRWKLSGFDLEMLTPTTDGGVVLARTVDLGAGADVAWLTLGRDGASDAVCAPVPAPLADWMPVLEPIELELQPLVLDRASDLEGRPFALPVASLSSHASVEVQGVRPVSALYDACEGKPK